tara:strand:+ start:2180 stop:3499 length:1320 start_codon:yes stop_codon:yes gene_type:complete
MSPGPSADGAASPAGTGRKFVVLAHHRITERDVDRFGCEFFTRRGYEVLLVSCWKVLAEEHQLVSDGGNLDNVDGTFVPATREAFYAMLDDLSPADLIIPTVGLTAGNAWMYRALSDRGLRYCCMTLGRVPNTWNIGGTPGPLRKLRALGENLFHGLHRGLARARNALRIGLDYFRIDPPLMDIRAGTYMPLFSHPYPFTRHSHKVDVFSFESGWAEAAPDIPDSLPEQFAVFVDGGITGLPDNVIWDLKGPSEPEAYFRQLRATLDRVERDLNIPIVIARHPKSSYRQEDLDRLFGGRQTFGNLTASLVRESKFILMHYSTAVSFAAIFKKPVLFLSSEIVRAGDDTYLIDVFASWFDQQPLDMGAVERDEIAGPITVPPMTDRVANRYRNNFLHAPCAAREPIWQVAATRFESLTPVVSTRAIMTDRPTGKPDNVLP